MFQASTVAVDEADEAGTEGDTEVDIEEVSLDIVRIEVRGAGKPYSTVL
jgi:hypothetical protein